MLEFYTSFFRISKDYSQDPTSSLIAKLKAERKRMAEEVVVYIRDRYETEGKGFAEVDSLREAHNIFDGLLSVVTALRGTRNLTYGQKSLLDSISDQREIFSKDLSMHGDKSRMESIEFKNLAADFEAFITDLFVKYAEETGDKWKISAIHQKGSSCLENPAKSGGRGSWELNEVNRLCSRPLTGKVLKLFRLAMDFAHHCNNLPLVKIEEYSRVFDHYNPENYFKPYFNAWTFQDMKYITCLIFNMEHGYLHIDMQSSTGHYLQFLESHLTYKGERIIEMADKERAVSISRASTNVIMGYHASQLRGIMLTTRPEMHEGYFGGEEMEPFLRRWNDSTDAISSPFDCACKSILAGSVNIPEIGDSTVFPDRMSNPNGGPTITDSGKTFFKSEKRLQLYVTDFKAATERISHGCLKHLARILRGLGTSGLLKGNMFLCSLASCVEFLATPFTIYYGKEDDYSKIVKSISGVGALMGRELTKEILHLLSDFASRTGDTILNVCRLLLGDDIACFNLQEFFGRLPYTGLVSNISKCQCSFIPQIQDRSMIIIRIGGKYGKYYLLASDNPPPKLFALVSKYTEGLPFMSNFPRIDAILRGTVSDDLTYNRFPEAVDLIQHFFLEIDFFAKKLQTHPGKGFPIHYGGITFMSAEEEAKWLFDNSLYQIAWLFVYAEKSGSPIRIYSAPRSTDWRSEGLIRVNDIAGTIKRFLPNDFVFSPGDKYLKENYMDHISTQVWNIFNVEGKDNDSKRLVHYVGAKQVFDILSSRPRLENFAGRTKVVHTELTAFDEESMLFNKPFLHLLSRQENRSGVVPRPTIRVVG